MTAAQRQQACIALTNIEHAAILGYIVCPLAAMTASMLRLELMGSETEIEALERAEKFIDSVKG